MTYTFTIRQNLNHLQDTYKSSGITDLEGKITQTKTITFVKETPSPAIPVNTQPVFTTLPVVAAGSSTISPITTVPTSSPIAKKTTYTPLPEWITLLGIVMAGLFIIRKRI
jgi:hypothetical protein